jgi:pantothenate kinase-related protein Tda10
VVAARLAEHLRRRGHRVAVVAMDDLYPGWDGLEAGVCRLLDGVLRPFLAGASTVTVRNWDWARDAEGDWQELAVPDLLIVEGAGCGARACAPYLAILAWVHAPDDVRKARALARDGAAFSPHWERWAAQERVHFAREGTRERADVVLAVP